MFDLDEYEWSDSDGSFNERSYRSHCQYNVLARGSKGLKVTGNGMGVGIFKVSTYRTKFLSYNEDLQS